MRKVFLQMVVSLDGYVAGPDGDLSWVFPGLDDDLRGWIVESLSGVDTQLLGRVSFLEQSQYWPTANEPLAPILNDSLKVVFSGTLSPDKLEWQNSRLAEGTPAEEVARLKEQPGKDIYVPGGGTFAQSLSAERLIDEYRLIVHPVVLGGGLPLFSAPIDLRLLETKAFGTGSIVLVYRPA